MYIFSVYIYVYIKLYEFLWMRCKFLKAIQSHYGDSLLFTRNSWYSLDQSRNDERLRYP